MPQPITTVWHPFSVHIVMLQPITTVWHPLSVHIVMLQPITTVWHPLSVHIVMPQLTHYVWHPFSVHIVMPQPITTVWHPLSVHAWSSSCHGQDVQSWSGAVSALVNCAFSSVFLGFAFKRNSVNFPEIAIPICAQLVVGNAAIVASEKHSNWYYTQVD